MGSKNGLERIIKLWGMIMKGVSGKKSFDSNLDQVKIISGGNGSISALMTIKDEHANQGGFLHGGMTALLVDDISGLAILTHPSEPNVGVSISMNIEYMKACPVGSEILIKASTEKVGKRIAFLTVDIFNKGTGEMVAKGTHVKFI